MLFIEGVGYVDETTYYANTQKTNTDTNHDFHAVLAEETSKISGSSRTLDSIFHEAADTYGISYDLLTAVAFNESCFNANAVSSAGAMGIMQLMPSTAASLGITNAYDPYENIMGGAKILKSFYDLYDGNINLMLAAYNAGPGNVEKYGGVPPFQEVKNYIEKIQNSLRTGVTVPGALVNVSQSQTASDEKTSNAIQDAYNNMSNQAYMMQLANNIIYNTLSSNSILGGESYSSISPLLNTTSNTLLQGSSLLKDSLSDFSYEEYNLLVEYFDRMMNIISNIGSSDADNNDKDYGNNSLQHLYQLGNTNKASTNYNWNHMFDV